MAFDFYLDKNTHDFIYKNGQIQLTQSKPELLRQRLAVVFKTFTGEWFNNTSFGAIDRNLLFKVGITKAEIDAFFRSIVTSYEEVNTIREWVSELDPFTREYSLNYVVETDYGIVADYLDTSPPDVEVDYTQVLPPSTAIPCEFDDLVNLANQLYEILNNDYSQLA